MRLGASQITLVYAKMVSYVYRAHLHRPLISISTPKNRRLMEGAQLDTTASLGTLNQGLAPQEPTILIPNKANATYVHVDNIVRELLLVVQVDYARKATYVEMEKLYLIRRKVLRLTIITLRAEFKEFYVLTAII